VWVYYKPDLSKELVASVFRVDETTRSWKMVDPESTDYNLGGGLL
jgi:hypothetical protein